MNSGRRSVIKWCFAVLVGAPVTWHGASYVAVGFMLSVVFLIEPGVDSVTLAMILLWCFAGLLGLVGFWLWVFQPQRPSKRQRMVHATLVALGVVAVLPLAIFEKDRVAITGAPGGMAVVVQSLLSSNAFERTGESHASR